MSPAGRVMMWAVIGLVVFFVILGSVYVFRYLSNSTAPVVVIEVVPGVLCAKLVTADGAAIDCWAK